MLNDAEQPSDAMAGLFHDAQDTGLGQLAGNSTLSMRLLESLLSCFLFADARDRQALCAEEACAPVRAPYTISRRFFWR